MEMYEKPMTPATMDTERKGSHTANNGCGGSNSEDAMKLRASLDSKDMGGAYYARRLFRALYTDEEIMSMTAAGQRSDKAVPMDVLTAVELEACRVFDFLLYFTDENKARKIQPNSKRKKRKEPSRKIYPPGTVPEGKIARECTIVEIFNDLKHNLISDDAESVENLEVGYTTNKDIDAAELTTPNHRAAQESRSNAQESPLPNISPVLRSIGPWQMSNSSHQSTPKHLPLYDQVADQRFYYGMTQHYNQWGRYQQHSTFQPSSSIDTSYPAWQSHYHKHVNENPQPSGIVPEVAHFGQKTSDRNSTGNDLPTLTNSSEPHLDGSHSHYQNL
ncbi:hypothetical protein B566_EDAN011283 [Ephemera danica]|nr:hypothetical protein B566_EDAN011283 [Ephemera danica]